MKYINDINGERVYKEADVHWRMVRLSKQRPALLLCHGNPNNGSVPKGVKDVVDNIKTLQTMEGIKQFAEEVTAVLEECALAVRRGKKLHKMARLKLKILVPKGTYFSALRLVRAIEKKDDVFIDEEAVKLTVPEFIEKVLFSSEDEIAKRYTKNIQYYRPCIPSIIKIKEASAEDLL